jgi:formylglycine-generating enzyme required for sulfatase activity/phage replication-related protein YjqB (UPF0714/DUF867 family)
MLLPRLWSLEQDGSQEGAPALCLRSGFGAATSAQPPCRPQELLDPNGRRLILVISDCIDPRWDTQLIRDILQVWSNHGPLGLVQVLPEWLWSRTALNQVTKGQMLGFRPGQPSQSLSFIRRERWRRKSPIGVKVPVVTLEPAVATRWSQMVAGRSSVTAPGLIFSPVTVQQLLSPVDRDHQSPKESLSELTPQERLDQFRDFSSPMARRLAGFLAACPEVNLPVVRMVQAAMLPDSQQVHVAEVLLGGLFKPQTDITAHTPADQVQYVFHEGVQPLVQETIPPKQAFDALSAWVKLRFDCALEDFPAYITTENLSQIKPFAGVMLDVLKRRGSQYAEIASHIERVYHPQYTTFTELTQGEAANQDYEIRSRVGTSDSIVLAIHGGNLQPGTTQIAAAVAGDLHSFYSFISLKPEVDQTLYLASTQFNEPMALDMVSNAQAVLSIDGCEGGSEFIKVGGLDANRRELLRTELQEVGFTVSDDILRGTDPDNICNRGRDGQGVQVEISRGLRDRFLDTEGEIRDLSSFTQLVEALQCGLQILPGSEWERSPRRSGRSRNWAICIGINDYYNLQRNKYAVQDASALRDLFLNELQFEEVYYFSDDSPPIETPRGSIRSLPTYANLSRFFRERFREFFLEEGDTFWFFFAGHGERYKGHDYLMPMDVDPGNVEKTALRISDIAAHLQNSGASVSCLFLDACCYQGRRSGIGFGSEEQSGVITFYSCSPREYSSEIDELQHGAFTYALLEGLRLGESNNCATVERLDQYLRYQVPMLCERFRRQSQTPYAVISLLVFSSWILLPQKATAQDLQALKLEAYQAEIVKNHQLSQKLWRRVLVVDADDREAIDAIQRIAALEQAVTQPDEAFSLPLQTLAFDIGQLVETAEPDFSLLLKTQTFNIATITLTETSPQDSLQMFEFQTATLEKQLEGWFQRRANWVIKQRVTRNYYFVELLAENLLLEMIFLPAGTFLMGSQNNEPERLLNEFPQHDVTVQSFFMGRYPITQAQWCFVASLPQVHRELAPEPSNFRGPNRPVEQISWYDAVEFCDRISSHTGRQYRLPTEAEWEYACRAGTTTPFHFGETLTADLANYNATRIYGAGPKGEYRLQTIDVGSFPANAFGLCDMHGNVLEWCQDHWHTNYKGAPTDGSAWLTEDEQAHRVRRGGSWLSFPKDCRSAYRDWLGSDSRSGHLGFRVCCSPPRN